MNVRRSDTVTGSLVTRFRRHITASKYSQLPTTENLEDDDSKLGKSCTVVTNLRNFVTTILACAMSIGIVMLPFLQLRSSTQPYPRVVISLTTIPERLPHLQPVLESLLYLSYSADAIYLVLAQQAYYSEEVLQYEPYPDFLQEMMLKTNLEILRPMIDYGPASKVVYALDKEASIRSNQQMEKDQIMKTVPTTTTTTTTRATTRIIYLDDDILYHHDVIKRLVDASLVANGDVVALSGGLLRNKFRQLKHSNLKYDKHPNLYMHASNSLGKGKGENGEKEAWRQVDIVQGFTGVCIPSTIDTKGIHEVFSTQDRSKPLPTRVFRSDDIVLSATFEAQNVTRWIIPGIPSPKYNTNSTKIKPLSKGMHKNLMESVHYIQRAFHIWQNHNFLDLNALTKEQVDAIDCEASHDQDCSLSEENNNMCWPHPKKCPGAKKILEEITPKT